MSIDNDLRDFNKLDEYKEKLIGKTISDVFLNTMSDEGLYIVFTDGTRLRFGFSGCEGAFEISGRYPEGMGPKP